MRKKIFGPTFSPANQPGFQSRFKSLDGLFGTTINQTKEDSSPGIFADHSLRKRYKSNLVPETLPSVVLRKKGVL